MNWDSEAEEYRLKKMRDGEETAMLLAVIFFALAIVVLISVVSERWVMPWLMR
jgi:hypothetical protein